LCLCSAPLPLPLATSCTYDLAVLNHSSCMLNVSVPPCVPAPPAVHPGPAGSAQAPWLAHMTRLRCTQFCRFLILCSPPRLLTLYALPLACSLCMLSLLFSLRTAVHPGPADGAQAPPSAIQ
jgi:hypothetical protein